MPWVKLKPAPKGRVDPGQLRAGIRIELEHTRDRKAAEIIAKHHLAESKFYYEALKIMERELERMR
jgi:hypothetical protein